MSANQQRAAAYAKRLEKAKREVTPSQGFFSGDGVRVVLSREPGLTARKLLKTPFFFSVPPQDDVAVTGTFSHTDYDTLGSETFSAPGSKGLRTISLTMMLLDWDATFAVWHNGPLRGWRGGNLYDDADLVDTAREESVSARSMAPMSPLVVSENLMAIMESGTPVRLSVGQPVWNGRMNFSAPVTLRQVTVVEKAGEPDTRYSDLQFTEFRKPGLLGRKRVPPDFHKDLPSWLTIYEKGNATSDEKRNIGSAEDPVTLAQLATIYYGSASKWRFITQAPQNREWRKATPNTPLKFYARESKRIDRLFIPKAPKATGAKKKGGK